MKTNKCSRLFLLAIFGLVLSACGTNASSSLSPSSSSSSSGPLSMDTSSSLESSSESSSSSSNSNLTSIEVEDPATSDVKKDAQGNYVLDFYCMNDFHGAVAYDGSTEPGIARISTYLKGKRNENPGGTYILSAGDMWQGSADSNLTRGHLVTECMNDIGFEAMALGNHEFDWTTDTITDNQELADFPLLACNIKDKAKSEEAGETVLWDVPESYIMIERKDFKVGVIGSIGEGITSSILATNVVNFEFLDPTPYVVEAADELRYQGADLIVYLTHNGKDSVSSQVLDCVDLVFNGHTHEEYAVMKNGVPIVQAGVNGENVSHISITIPSDRSTLSVSSYEFVNSQANICPLKEEAAVYDIYQAYYEVYIKDIKERVVGHLDAPLSAAKAAMLCAEVTYLKYCEIDTEIIAGVNNTARSSFEAGDVTYGDVYNAFPFDNYITVLTMTGKQVKTFFSYGYAYSSIDTPDLDSTKTYKIVTIDYLAAKYPSSYSESKTYNDFARDIVADYLSSKMASV